jgi:16S rRNA (guanine966-N2)-methyltransferase
VRTPKGDEPPQQGRNSVRIIGGIWRGRRVGFPDTPGLRPTPDRVRETLFNWLQNSIAGARCLDLFAGSGALGLEALSRGAGHVVFVEQSPAVSRILQQTLASLKGSINANATANARIMEMGAARFLRTPIEPFDIVFLDPPFGLNALAEYIPLIEAGGWLKPAGLLYLENERESSLPTLPPHWEVLKSKSAGQVGYHLVRANARS